MEVSRCLLAGHTVCSTDGHHHSWALMPASSATALANMSLSANGRIQVVYHVNCVMLCTVSSKPFEDLVSDVSNKDFEC